jgi:hypothetical protein
MTPRSWRASTAIRRNIRSHFWQVADEGLDFLPVAGEIHASEAPRALLFRGAYVGRIWVRQPGVVGGGTAAGALPASVWLGSSAARSGPAALAGLPLDRLAAEHLLEHGQGLQFSAMEACRREPRAA